MRALLKNDYLYYTRNKTKLLLSIVFIISFLFVVIYYDRQEVKLNKENAIELRVESYKYRRLAREREVILDLYREKYGSIVYDMMQNIYFADDFWFSKDGEDLLNKINTIQKELSTSTEDLYNMYNDFSSSLQDGLQNKNTTEHRLKIVNQQILIYDLLNNSSLDLVDENFIQQYFSNTSAYSYNDAHIEKQRLDILKETNTPDDTNYFAITNSNYGTKVFEGFSLFIILVFILLLFYDLFAKDFDTNVYRTLYSSPFKRSKIILSKLIFAFGYTFFLIICGVLISHVFIFIQRPTGFEIVGNRYGFIMHPHLINLNPLSLITKNETLTITSLLLKNIITLLTGTSIIVLWISLINIVSFKLKSSSSTLTIGVFTLLALYVVNMFSVRELFTFILPIFGFNYDYILSSTTTLNFYYIIIVSIIYVGIIHIYLLKDILTMDILDGDSND